MPGTLQLVTVTKTPIRIQSLLIQNDTVMLVNPDTVNNIFIGNDPGSQVIPVPALGSVTLDTKKHDLWVSTNGGAFTVQAFLMPNGSGWVPSPAQVAAQINALGLAKDTTLQTTNTNTSNTVLNTGSLGLLGIMNGSLGPSALISGTNRSIAQDMKDANAATTTEIAALVATGNAGGAPGGVPVLRGTDNLGTATNSTLVGGGVTTLLSTVAINKPSFEAIFQLYLPSVSGTIPFAILGVQWTDSNTGLVVGFKQYALSSGNGVANVLSYYLSGPCRGNQLTVTLTNLDPAQTLTYTWAVNKTSHVYTIDRLLQPNYSSGAGPIGFNNPAGNPSKGVLMHTNPSIGPNANVTRLTAASNAKCKLSINNSAQNNPCTVSLQDPNGLYNLAAATAALGSFDVAVNSKSYNEIQMPNGPLQVVIFNNAGTNTIAPQVAITVMEY